jgi:hypothetical protein
MSDAQMAEVVVASAAIKALGRAAWSASQVAQLLAALSFA